MKLIFGQKACRHVTDTVSEIVSKRAGGVVKNTSGLKQIIIDFTGDFAILSESDRTFQVAARQAGGGSLGLISPVDCGRFMPQDLPAHFRYKMRHNQIRFTISFNCKPSSCSVSPVLVAKALSDDLVP